MPGPNNVPSIEDLQKYAVNANGWEVIRQPLYDSAVYPTTGVNTLSFFSTPIGQGVGAGGGVKTLTDTNMNLAGQLPAQQAFLMESIEVLFEPTRPTSAAQMPAAFGNQAIAQIINDAYIFRTGGNLNLQIGSKSYMQDGPLMKFPAPSDFALSAALSDVTTAGANLQSRIGYGKAVGKICLLRPVPIFLQANQNFNVTLAWPEGLQVITSAARVVVTLGGLLYRRSQ